MKILVLSGHDVHDLLPYGECADVMRGALADLARGRIQQPLRTIVRPRDAAGFMGDSLGLADVSGVTWTAVVDNASGESHVALASVL